MDKKTREEVGLARNSGPYRLITSKAMFDFDEKTKELRLIGVLKGLSVEEVVNDMGFKPLIADEVVELEPPTQEELKLLRKDIDPYGLIISKGAKFKVEI